jgi:zinc and cadmium transporter
MGHRLATVIMTALALVAPVFALDSNASSEELPSAAAFSATLLPELKGVVPWRTLGQVDGVREGEGSAVRLRFSKDILALDGQQVRIQGFSLPLDVGDQKHFLLAAVPPHCPFCMPAGPDAIVEVFAKEPIAYGFEPIVVAGNFAVLQNDPSGLWYQLTEAGPTAARPVVTLAWILVATLAAGILSVLTAAPLAFALARRWTPYLVSFAVGVLLGAAFLDLLPEAAESLPLNRVLATVLAGIFVFFMLEKLTLWHHAHPTPKRNDSWQRVRPAGPMILIGGGLHNFTDGVLLAAAFLTDVHLGLLMTAAVVAHEIPREMGDFAVLLDSGFSWQRALFWNVAFSVAAMVGGLLGYFALSAAQPAIPYVVALAAASFIYIAIADLVPGLHQHTAARSAVAQSLAIACGGACMALAVAYLG